MSRFCLYYEWVDSSISAGVFGSSHWCLAPAEITGVREGWAHEFSIFQWTLFWNPLLRSFNTKQTAPCIRDQQSVCLLYGHFSADFIQMALPMTAASRRVTGSGKITQSSGSTQHRRRLECLMSRPVLWRKDDFHLSCPKKSSLALPLVGMATEWHTDSPQRITVSA